MDRFPTQYHFILDVNFNFIFQKSESEDFVKNAITVLLTVSSLCENNQDIVKNQAVSTSVVLYKYLYEWASKNDKESLVTNALLVQLRLIKVRNHTIFHTPTVPLMNEIFILFIFQAEEKNSLIDCNQNACLVALQKAVDQTDIIPLPNRSMINLFLTKRKSPAI